MPQQHRALEWLSRRRDGESAAFIAHNAGVSEETVLRATKPYGAFPRPSRQLGRYQLSDEVLDERARRWVELRRRGRTTTSIAAAEGVAHQYVSQVTREHGPYPAPEIIQRWVEGREAGRTLAAIAEEAGVPIAMIRRETKPYGPFRLPIRRTPEGVETLGSIATRVGLNPVTILKWRDTGRLPEPDFVTASGRQVWLSSTIDRWLDDTDDEHEVCGLCGARCLSVSRHVGAVHPEERGQRSRVG